MSLTVVVLMGVLWIWLRTKMSRLADQAGRDHERLEELLTRVQALELALRGGALPAREAGPEAADTPGEEWPGTAAPEPETGEKSYQEMPEYDWETPEEAVAATPARESRPEAETEQAGSAAPGSGRERPAVNWEQFMGVKLFAWLGGIALFLGVAFFIKYSFEHNLISPPVRVAGGVLVGLGLLAGGLLMDRRRYAITVQTLCAAGVLILYADIFAACSFYHLLPNAAAFALMILITFTAFLLSLRLDAQAVAIIGMLGGFLTPPLLSTGEDRPLALFSYIAMLDAGLIALALIKRWGHLCLLAAVATMAMQFGWAEKFFQADKIHTAQGVFIFYTAFFIAAFWHAQRKDRMDRFISAAACLPPAAALLFSFYLLVYPYPEIARRPFQVFCMALAGDAALLVVSWHRSRMRWVNMAAGTAVFLLLTVWIASFLSMELLNPALVLCLLFAILHGAYPVVLERLKPAGSPAWWGHVFAPAALLLTMIPLLTFEEPTIAVWLAVLVLNALAVMLALATAAISGILAVLLITAALIFFWVAAIPVWVAGLWEMLVVVGAFAAFFLGVSAWILRRAGRPATEVQMEAGATFPFRRSRFSVDLSRQIPAVSALLPFLLLIMVTLKQTLADPSPVFGLALLLGILLYGIVLTWQADSLAVVGLLGVVCLEQAWFANGFTPERAALPLAWLVAFYALFSGFPFGFQKRMAGRVVPWAAAALAGPLQFFFVYRLVRTAYMNPYMGLLPALFALPSLLALVRLIRTVPFDTPEGRRLSALFGGVALFFITAVFPIQFEKQWITIGWALEGAALLWLFRRIPHPGLKIVGAALLTAAFIRLALNIEVIQYHRRSNIPVFNWYLYAYGLVSLCLFAGARLLRPPDHRIKNVDVRAVLYGLGTVLTFLLLNIEIADYFSTGPYIRFEFSGSFGRDMTYSLAWAVFAFVLLVVGIRQGLAAVRYAGIGLLVVTLLKLFLHDLWSLGGLYRIGALMGLALVLIPVSFLYQRFLSERPAKPTGKQDGI
ncbi:MAG: DUF2339 domain-containing protein [Thermodesulfobacteriota bacterium]